MGMVAFGFFFCHGDGGYEVHEAFAVVLGRDGGDLGAVVGQAFPGVFDLFNYAVLFLVSRKGKGEGGDFTNMG
jgi:hypothetical protein